MGAPRITLEQWRAFKAVVDAGGHAQAAVALNKSQSAVTHAITSLQALLDVRVFEIVGRRSVLTDAGRHLYERARLLLDEADALESSARYLARGWDAEIRVATEVIFPVQPVLASLDRFGRESPQTRIELIESVLSGTEELLRSRAVDLAITPLVPIGMSGEPVATLRFVPVVHRDHALHRLGRELALRDLRRHRHIVVRDSGSRRERGTRSVDVDQRWTVSQMATSVAAVRAGYGFAWLPEHLVRGDLADGTLVVLPIAARRLPQATFHLVHADAEGASPGVRRLAALLRADLAASCMAAGQVTTS